MYYGIAPGATLSGLISTRTRRRTAAAAGSAQPTAGCSFGLGRVPRPFSPPVDPSPRNPRLDLAAAQSTSRAPTPVPTVSVPSDRDRAESLGAPLLGLSTPSEPPSAPTTNLNALSAATELQFGDFAARYSYTDRERKQRAELMCHAVIHPMHSPPTAIGPAHRILRALPLEPAFLLLPKAASVLPTRASFSSSVIQPRTPTPYNRRDARLAFWGTNQFVFACS